MITKWCNFNILSMWCEFNVFSMWCNFNILCLLNIRIIITSLCFIFIPANRCYFIVHSKVNWTSAASACKTAYPGASLATISNIHEQGMLSPGKCEHPSKLFALSQLNNRILIKAYVSDIFLAFWAFSFFLLIIKYQKISIPIHVPI